MDLIYLAGLLVLVASGFAVRRLPIGPTLRMAAAWILIFGGMFAIFALRDDIIGLGKRILSEGGGEGTVVQAGQELRIRKSLDGHFWVNAELNGKSVRFLVDSGATTTSISTATARRAGIEQARGFPAYVRTANGVVAVARGRAERIQVGSIERTDMAVHMSDAFGDLDVLGMNFLSSLRGWGVEGQWLILKP